MTKLDVFYKRLNYKFHDTLLLQLAFTHRSASRENNERLEFLGDSILNCIVGAQIYHYYSSADEGILSRYRATLVKEASLAQVARSIHLGEYLLLGPGELKSGGGQRDSILADGFEAVLGAIFLEGGFTNCENTVRHLFYAKILALGHTENIKDPKTRLQELLQSEHKPLPDYQLVEVSGEAHARHFVIECKSLPQGLMVQGAGSSRRRAEQDAASKLLHKLLNE